MATEFRATMMARVVESFRGPWSPYGDAIRDPGVALDAAAYLEASHGPTVLRVATSRPPSRGITGAVRDRCEGDWLCDPAHGVPNVRLPTPRWSYSLDSRQWSERFELIDAWETCPVASWMLHAAASALVPIKKVVAAAAACALLIAESEGQEAAARCARTAAAWAGGKASLLDVRSARREASAAAQLLLRRVSTAADRAHAAALSAVYAADIADIQRNSPVADAVGDSARMAGDVVGRCEWFISRGVASACTASALRHVTTTDYLRAVRDRVEGGSEPRGWSDRSVVS